jgi:hypothetical protein
LPSAGHELGEISVLTIDSSTSRTAGTTSSLSATQRMRYWISVFGTEALTL